MKQQRAVGIALRSLHEQISAELSTADWWVIARHLNWLYIAGFEWEFNGRLPRAARPVDIYKDNKYITTVSSVTRASNYIGLGDGGRGRVGQVLKGMRHTCHGYSFKYADI